MSIHPRHVRRLLLSACLLLLAVGICHAQENKPLPEGNNGLAAKHAGDVGIADNPEVIFACDFEDVADAEALRRRWDNVFHDKTIRITDEAPNVHSGAKALELIFPKDDGAVGNGLMKHLKEETDVLFLRYYQKMEKGLDVSAAGSFHSGGTISAHYHVDGHSTPGKRADGRNKFLVGYECSIYSDAPRPGNLGVYVYHPEQRHQWGDYFFPTGIVMPNTSKRGDYGKDFVPRPDVRQELDRWQCYELMVQANTAGKRDGRIACWLDGKLIADFTNLRLRDVDTLKIDYATIGGYINPNKAKTNRIWFDDVVVARSYIGPRVAR